MKFETVNKDNSTKVSTPAENKRIITYDMLKTEVKHLKRQNKELKDELKKSKETIEIPIEPIKAMLNSFKSKWKYKRINPKTGKNWYPNCDIIADVIENFLKKSVK